ncbi:MAG: TolC family protein [Planctomycetota bacterium]|nr:TolC family protein [Planctomycetota bacterium]
MLGCFWTRTAPIWLLLTAVWGCKSPTEHRMLADERARDILEQKQKEAFGRTEPFTIERPSDTLRRRLIVYQNLPHVGRDSLGTDLLERIDKWPEDYPEQTDPATLGQAPWDGAESFTISLEDALAIGARNSRDYQAQKESVFRAALDLDLSRNSFRRILGGSVDAGAEADLATGGNRGVTGGADLDVSRLLKTGAAIAGAIGVDIVKLLTGGKDSSFGLFGDASISIPLLRGAGRHVVTEPLTQSERNVIYSLRNFERFKRTFAVSIATEYLDVLRLLDRLANQEENYRGLVTLSRRTLAMAGAGRLPGVQVDQARQDELRARDGWIGSWKSYEDRLDRFKQSLGLPPDANIELQRDDLTRMAEKVRELFPEPEDGDRPVVKADEIPAADAEVELTPPDRENAGPLELEEDVALGLAFDNRQDLMVTRGRVYDAQRSVVVAADALRAGLTLTGAASAGASRSLGSATSPNADFDPSEGFYTLDSLLDLPLERTAERNAYRDSYIDLEQSVRSVQDLEDQIKIQVRETLRSLLQTRESVAIQIEAVRLARDRVRSTNLFLQAGRAQVRDVLEAQEAFLAAQNSLTQAMVDYRVAALEMQRDLGVLQVDSNGMWIEYEPNESA